jgi:hypothetical protein
MSKIYAIVDVPGYVSQMREAAAKSLSENYSDNLDDYISIGQMVVLLKEECLGFDDNNRPLLNEDTNSEIFDQTATWIYNVGLAKLASQDLIECAWDNTTNAMVFWFKQKTSETKAKNEYKRNKNKKSKG